MSAGHASGVASLAEVDANLALARVDVKNAETDSGLRRYLGFGALGVMAAQILTADTAFFLYGANNGWKIPVAAINVWLGATVVQVVIVVHTVARYLFPAAGSRGWSRRDEAAAQITSAGTPSAHVRTHVGSQAVNSPTSR
jgi:hypothetical protein